MTRITLLLLVLLFFWWQPFSCAPRISVATFNIRMFPSETTDRSRLVDIIQGLDVDILAVQEIREEQALLDVLQAVSQRTGRDYSLALSSCKGKSGLALGIVFDRKRLRLLGTRQYREHFSDDRGSCSQGYRPALLAILEDRESERRVAALSVHLQHGPLQWEDRKKQWQGVVKILEEAKQEGTVIALGDFNTTGFVSNENGERSFIDQTLNDALLTLSTKDIGCTAYWVPRENPSTFAPSILDHMVTASDDWSTPEVQGMCQVLQCQSRPVSEIPSDYRSISDHCPVRIVLE